MRVLAGASMLAAILFARPAALAEAGGDPTPPVLTVRILQNTVLQSNLHVYLLADEELDPASIHIEDHTHGIPMAAASGDGRLFRGSYRVDFAGIHHFETQACDLAGNCSEETFAAGIYLAPPG